MRDWTSGVFSQARSVVAVVVAAVLLAIAAVRPGAAEPYDVPLYHFQGRELSRLPDLRLGRRRPARPLPLRHRLAGDVLDLRRLVARLQHAHRRARRGQDRVRLGDHLSLRPGDDGRQRRHPRPAASSPPPQPPRSAASPTSTTSRNAGPSASGRRTSRPGQPALSVDGTYGNFGAALHGDASFGTVMTQFPLKKGLKRGFVVQSGGRDAKVGRLTIGLTEEMIASFRLRLPMAPTGERLPGIGAADGPPGYLKAQVANTVVRLARGGRHWSGVIPTVFDTGGGDGTWAYGSSVPRDTFVKADSNEARTGTAFDLRYAGTSILAYRSGNTPARDILGFIPASADDLRINPGILMFYTYDVMFDLDDGFIGLRPGGEARPVTARRSHGSKRKHPVEVGRGGIDLAGVREAGLAAEAHPSLRRLRQVAGMHVGVDRPPLLLTEDGAPERPVRRVEAGEIGGPVLARTHRRLVDEEDPVRGDRPADRRHQRPLAVRVEVVERQGRTRRRRRGCRAPSPPRRSRRGRGRPRTVPPRGCGSRARGPASRGRRRDSGRPFVPASAPRAT